MSKFAETPTRPSYFLLLFNVALDYDDRNVLQKLCLNRAETQKVRFTAAIIHIRLKQHRLNGMHNDHCSRHNKVTTRSVFHLNFDRNQEQEVVVKETVTGFSLQCCVTLRASFEHKVQQHAMNV